MILSAQVGHAVPLPQVHTDTKFALVPVDVGRTLTPIEPSAAIE
jgi:hypothetical protein